MLIEKYSRNGLLETFRDLDWMERQLNSFFNGSGFPGTGEYPQLNVYSSEDSLKIKAFVPGIDPEKIDISLLGNTLTIRGETPQEEAHKALFRSERPTGKFERTIKVPFRAKAEGIDADYSRGILTVTVIKPEDEKPKKIPVNNGN